MRLVPHRASFVARLSALLSIVVCACAPLQARADIGVVIADPTNAGVSAYTHAGHAMVYLSNVCAESPIKARLCEPGEQGSVVSIYPNFHEQKPYEWNILPLSLYLEGSADPGDRLLYGSHALKEALAQHVRLGFLSEVCAGACPPETRGYWRDLVAATIERDVFIYAVKTTHAQDEAAVKWVNAQPNVNHYNGMTRNCAMYVRSLVNSIFPHAVHRDYLNDLGMMSPKAAARSFAHWAQKRPKLGFYCLHFAQKPGSVRRSGTASSGTEAAFHIKKYLIPAALIGDHEVAGSFFVAYFLTGRFNLFKESISYATPSLTQLQAERRIESRDDDQEQLHATREEIALQQADITGTPQEWQDYRRHFAAISEAADMDTEKDRAQMLKTLDQGVVSVDGDGNPWLTPQGSSQHVGVSSADVLAEGSDPELAFHLLAWRIGYDLQAKPRMRPGIQEFREDWTLFEEAFARWRPLEARAELPPQ